MIQVFHRVLLALFHLAQFFRFWLIPAQLRKNDVIILRMNIWISLSFQSLRNVQDLEGLVKFIPGIRNAVECYRIKKLGDTKKARSSDACAVIIITFPKIGSKYFGNSRFKNSNQRANENNHSTFY